MSPFDLVMYANVRFSVDEAAIGPGIGPAMVPPPITSLPPPPASLPAPPTSLPGATISSGPQPSAMPSGYPGQTPVSLPPLHYQGLNAPQPFGYQPPPPGMGMPMMHPSRMAALGGGGPGPSVPVAGVVRTADEMMGADDDPVTLAKRQRVEKLPGGHLYPEQNWIDMHPVCFPDFTVTSTHLVTYSILFTYKFNSPPIQPNPNGSWMAKSSTLPIFKSRLLFRRCETASQNRSTAPSLLAGCDWCMRVKSCETQALWRAIIWIMVI